jgi:hypothetical protein
MVSLRGPTVSLDAYQVGRKRWEKRKQSKETTGSKVRGSNVVSHPRAQLSVKATFPPLRVCGLAFASFQFNGDRNSGIRPSPESHPPGELS